MKSVQVKISNHRRLTRRKSNALRDEEKNRIDKPDFLNERYRTKIFRQRGVDKDKALKPVHLIPGIVNDRDRLYGQDKKRSNYDI